MAATPKPIIRLYDALGTGLILEWPSGVIYSNQTGGTSCLQPEFEGIFIPIGNDFQPDPPQMCSPEIQLSEHFESKYEGSGATHGIDEDDALAIEAALKKYRLWPQITVNRQRLRESHEAWIHVTVQHLHDIAVNLPPQPRQGILTWCNSD